MPNNARVSFKMPAPRHLMGAFIGVGMSIAAFFPISWGVDSVYRAYPLLRSVVDITQVQGTLWVGQATLLSAYLQIPVVFTWRFSLWDAHANLLKQRVGVGWDVVLMGNQHIKMHYSLDGRVVSTEALTIPLSIFTASTQSVMGVRGSALGELYISGHYRNGKGEGELRLNHAIWDTPLQTIILGDVDGRWQCESVSELACHMALQPRASLYLAGNVTWKEGHFSGEGQLQPRDALIQQGIKLIPSHMLAPLQLAPVSASNAWQWRFVF
jgi:hypothetical protein